MIWGIDGNLLGNWAWEINGLGLNTDQKILIVNLDYSSKLLMTCLIFFL